MKTIKTYEGFFKNFLKKKKEIPTSLSKLNSTEINKIKQDIKDAFIDLEHNDFNIIIDANLHLPYSIIFIVDIGKNLANFNKFKYDNNIDESLLFAIPYLEDEYKLKIYDIEFRYEVPGSAEQPFFNAVDVDGTRYPYDYFRSCIDKFLEYGCDGHKDFVAIKLRFLYEGN